ncbi:hypothetical protein C3B44_03385 [Corynebacterium yudongzhengii]|uniref:Uncharacterized protein n=2 Tax=Corynebacterium yudongzhengii TaxID=2080740 RepID=A0A2U1T7H6_9CORY|nr:hypothetical protein C3B44_03385 [Corynebacterium yudongzhengii]PWC01915.1 hypothetical protein DF222_04860 [Corynebacterium yudongzhengii]
MYPVLVLAAVVTLVVLFAYETEADGKRYPLPENAEPAAPPPPGPPGPEPADIAVLFNPALIEVDYATDQAHSMLIEGEATDNAMQNTGALAEHLAQMTADHCIDNLAISTPAELTLKIWSYCHVPVDPEAVETLTDFAVSHGAGTVRFSHYPGPGQQRASMVWETDDPEEFRKITEDWKDIELPAAIAGISFVVYATGEAGDTSAFGDISHVDGLNIITPWSQTGAED